MKILLIYPEVPATFWSFKHALKFVNKKAALPPLGLLTVSSLLPSSWDKRLVDLNISKLKDSDIEWADYVFISGMIVQKASAAETISRVKKFNKFVVAGGPLFTTGYSEFEEVDCFVLNEGEVTIPMFLADLEKGTLQHMYTSTEKPDITHTPVPDWPLIKLKDYASMALQISRGCPFNCEFCDIVIINGRVPRVKTPQQVITEFDALYNAGWRGSLFIVDDNFIGNKVKVTAILKEIGLWMKQKKRPFVLYTEASINLADDPEIMHLMREANFNCVFVGIETPEEEGLQSCNKVQNTGKDLRDKVRILQNNGFEVQAGFIVGFDTDTVKTFDNMIKFIQSSGIVTAMVGLLNALPETQLFKRLHSTGRILKKPSSGNNTDFTINFIPKMDKDTLILGYKRVLNSIFSPKNYYSRIKTHLKEYRMTSKTPPLPLHLQIRALWRVVWKLGIREKGQHHFWKLFIWTTFCRPKMLPNAITLSIFGFHYRRVLTSQIEA
ncbi:MAG TPA: DUF4070 domain-containing protein [Chitinispirillaceae bacterium]|nr:DUF4070 domain-containing protein [Chitinispirillaceae bacterium]